MNSNGDEIVKSCKKLAVMAKKMVEEIQHKDQKLQVRKVIF